MSLTADLDGQSKGQFALALVTTLLEYAGYLVRRVGIEEMAADVRRLREWEGEIVLPPALPAMPDLRVISEAQGEGKPVGVKFWRRFDDATARELAAALAYQHRYWPDAWEVIVTGEPPIGPSGDYQDHAQVVVPEGVGALAWRGWAARRRARLPTLGAVFRAVHGAPGFHAEVDRLTAVLRAWADA